MKSPGVPCFIYHGFYQAGSELAGVPGPEMRYYLSVAQFGRHLDHLAEQGFRGCSVADYLSEPEAPQEKRVILTFDDGHISNYTWVWPMLRARGFRGTFFIVANWVGQPDRMNREQLKELVGGGMSVGSHGLTHARMGDLPLPDLDEELVQSREKLEGMLDIPIRHLAFPGGVYNGQVLERAERAGYECVCTSVPGLAASHSILHRLSVTSLTELSTVSAFARREKGLLLRTRVRYEVIRGVKGLIGRNFYEKVLAALFGSAAA